MANINIGAARYVCARTYPMSAPGCWKFVARPPPSCAVLISVSRGAILQQLLRSGRCAGARRRAARRRNPPVVNGRPVWRIPVSSRGGGAGVYGSHSTEPGFTHEIQIPFGPRGVLDGSRRGLSPSRRLGNRQSAGETVDPGVSLHVRSSPYIGYALCAVRPWC